MFKNKINYGLKFILSCVAIFVASCLFAISFVDKKVNTALAYATPEYSSVDNNGLVLMTEKVNVISTDDGVVTTNSSTQKPEIDQENFNTPLFKTSSSTNPLDSINSLYYQSIPNAEKDKFVIYDNQFIELDNIKTGNYYESKISKTAYEKIGESDYQSVKLAEAVMVSFGTTLFKNGEASPINENGATMLTVQAKLNGEQITLPSIRQEANAQSFAWVIPQIEGWEGYYQLHFSYFFNEQQYTQDFSFYIIYNSSYETSTTFTDGNSYSSKPNLACYNKFDFNNEYHLGVDSKNYPVLTYDYTRYNLSYIHTANGVVANYQLVLKTDINTNTKYIDVIKTVNGSSSSKRFNLNNYDNGNSNQFVTIVLTEMGSYKFSYQKVYNGYNAQNAVMNIEETDINLNIYGGELFYSVPNYDAQMRYLVLATNPNDKVDIVVPNGTAKGVTPSEKEVGVIYSLKESAEKVGTVLTNDQTKTNNDANIKLDLSDYSTIVNSGLKITTATSMDSSDITNYTNFINYISSNNLYAKTNQAPFYLRSNDQITANSYYFYSKSPLTFNDLFNETTTEGITTYTSKHENYTNQVSFNKNGYYLAFIEFQPVGKTAFTQVFAFAYTNDTPSISVMAGGVSVGAKRYTNKEVEVSWEEPAIFDRAISAKYYVSYNEYKTNDELLNLPANNFNTNPQTFSISSGFACYLVVLNGEQATEVKRSFVIDKTEITGLNAYAVSVSSVGQTQIYNFAKENGEDVVINNAIFNNITTLFWNDKPSKAKVDVSYTWTPIYANSSAVKEIEPSTDSIFYTTKYSFGSTVGSFKFNRAEKTSSNLVASQYFSQPGLYIFTLTDEAGNSCKYMFIIDKSEAYFKVIDNENEPKYLTNENIISATGVRVETATHKAIIIENNDLKDLINDTLNDESYYAMSGTNKNRLNNLFVSVGPDYYLAVKLNKIGLYNDYNAELTTTSINSKNTGFDLTTTNKNSYLRNLYIVGENQFRLDKDTNSNSKLKVEINKDKSLGMVYYTNNIGIGLTDISFGEDNAQAKRLYAGEDITEAYATSDNIVVFSWLNGAGDTAVTDIEINHYNLATTYSPNYGFYATTGSKVFDLTDNSDIVDSNETRSLVKINISDNKTQEGLYVITRTLQNGETLNYWFIVDRNNIIESNNNLIGKFIKINLLEDETPVDNFSTTGSNPSYLNYINSSNEKEIDNKPYYTYTTTNKVPLTLSVPVGKYFDGSQIASYNAARLNFALYFVDTNRQLTSDGQSVKLFETTMADNVEGKQYYDLDLTKLVERQYLNKFVYKQNETDWICLPGDYILIIKDNVNSFSGNHEKVIGFKITNQELTTDIYSIVNTADTSSNAFLGQFAKVKTSDGVYTLTTNQQYVKIDMEQYNTTSEQAQIDWNYLVVTKTDANNVTTDYIRYEYAYQGGLNYLNADFVSEYNKDGKTYRTVYLDMGNTDQGRVVYDIYLRYKLAEHLDCYYYFNGDVAKTYYQTHYQIIIDRTAPSDNINNLVNEPLAYFYGGSDIFENYTYNQNGLYFVNRYAEFYGTDDANKIFAFAVGDNTHLSKNDIETFYIKEFSKDNFTLPLIDKSSYNILIEADNVVGDEPTYDAFNLTNGTYYEIVEMDKAGNTTQYVVIYNPSNEDNVQMQINDIIIDENVDDSYAVYDIENVSLPVHGGDFYAIEINNNFYTTGIETNYSLLADEIKQVLNNFGGYNVKIHSRSNTVSTRINHYDINNVPTLDVSKLVYKEGNNYYINLSRANDVINNIYAETITVNAGGTETQYVYNYDKKCYVSGNQDITNPILCSPDTLYRIGFEDSVDRHSDVYMFHTSGKDYYNISFGEDKLGYANQINNVYYSYQQANIYIDSAFGVEVQYSKNGGEPTIVNFENADEFVSKTGNYITLLPYKKDIGAIMSYTVKIKDNETILFTYNVVLDTTTGNVNLVDSSTDKNQTLAIDFDANYADTKPKAIVTGDMNLIWTEPDNEYFTYQYSLWKFDGTNYTKTPIENQFSVYLNSEGQYKFVVDIYANENYLGNKVYTFQINAKQNDLYFVYDGTNEVISNSTFNVDNLEGLTINYAGLSYAGNVISSLPNDNYPLYITTKDLVVSENVDLGASKKSTTVNIDGNTLTIYRIYTNTYSIYLATLKINPSSEIVSDLKLVAKAESSSETDTITKIDKELSLIQYAKTEHQLTFKYPANGNILDKNLIKLEVSYKNMPVGEFDINAGLTLKNNEYIYKILGNGDYSFRFKDLAGNVHEFETEYITQDYIEIAILREIVVSLDNVIPLNNAFYNNEVNVRVENSYDYDLGSIKLVQASRNGEDYQPIKNLYTWTFNKFGNYSVKFEAKIAGQPIEKVINFTIINQNEARNSIGLSFLSGCDITRVVDNNNQDITEKFNQVLKSNSSNIGLTLRYEDLAEIYGVDSWLLSGKYSFNVSYAYSDNIYPTRTHSFTFTLNDEQPYIECNLKPGEISNKEFTISFNPGIIYQQIGDGYILINGEIVAEINQDSLEEVIQKTITEKQNGAGDYYISLVSSSGIEHVTFKVSLKQPLNAWAIIIIVIVSAVVITITTVIIVLRTKMRIR